MIMGDASVLRFVDGSALSLLCLRLALCCFFRHGGGLDSPAGFIEVVLINLNHIGMVTILLRLIRVLDGFKLTLSGLIIPVTIL